MPQTPEIPINTIHLIPVLDSMLIDLLKSLSHDQWSMPTLARRWTVKDIAAHLLDGNLRNLSASRDQYSAEKPVISNYQELVRYLNDLNHEWTNAFKRVSPPILIEWLETSGKQYAGYLATLDPLGEAIYPVAWAGQTSSPNWFHIAREYTEKYIHQQQIRDAVGMEGIMTKELFYPFIQTMMQGMPHTYRQIHAEQGTLISVEILSDIGGSWDIIKKTNAWEMTETQQKKPDATISIDPAIAWKLFSKGISPAEALSQVKISGNHELGKIALEMVSVMA